MDDDLKRTVEALLFASTRPLSASDIHGWLLAEPAARIQAALESLQAEYEALGRSFFIGEVAGGFQFRTRPQYGPAILKMVEASPARLSRAALETLAIVAYKQPVIRQEIEMLRGVDAGSILRTLLEKELIRIVGRKNVPGRPLIYGTTRRFLEVFDLKDLTALPQLKDIQELGVHEEEDAPPPAGQEEEREPQEAATAPEKNGQAAGDDDTR